MILNVIFRDNVSFTFALKSSQNVNPQSYARDESRVEWILIVSVSSRLDVMFVRFCLHIESYCNGD